MKNLWWKVCSIFIMLILVWIGGLLPTRLSKLGGKKSEIALSLGSAFSGGVFLCVGLAHLLPDANDYLKDSLGEKMKDMPIAELIAIAGFLIVFYVEKVLLSAGAEHHHAVAISTAASAKHQHADVIVVPRQVITHYSARYRKRHNSVSGRIRAASGYHNRPDGTLSVAESRFGRSASLPLFVPPSTVDSSATLVLPPSSSSTIQAVDAFADRLEDQAAARLLQPHRDDDDRLSSSSEGEDLQDGHREEEEEEDHEAEHIRLLDEAHKQHGHSHHHIDVSTGRLVPYILALVLSIHSFIEGLVLGVQTSASQTTVLLIAIASHKWIEAFAFGTSFVREGVKLTRWLGVLAIYSITTPVGIAVGIFLSNYLSGTSASIVEGVMEALATGTFLYVAILDIIGEEFENPGPWPKRYAAFAAMLVGIVLIALVVFWDLL